MHCMTVSLAQGGAGLGTLWGEELAQEVNATRLVKTMLCLWGVGCTGSMTAALGSPLS